VLILSLSIFISLDFDAIVFPLTFYFLLIQNIFVLWKIFRWNILKPKITKRLTLIAFILFILEMYLIYFILFLWHNAWVYIFILWNLLFLPFLIFFVIFISLPLVNYMKIKIIKKAIIKSENNNSTIKIWITWSYWKSSTKEFLSSILEQDAVTLKTPDNINTELWVSKVILNYLNNSYKYFVAEMWAYRIWEISMLWKIVNHKYGFLTAIWIQHLWLFWSKENIIIAKSEIAQKVLKNNWTLYINWDNEIIRNIKFDKNLNIVKYWLLDWADAKSKITEIKNGKTFFEFTYKNQKIDFLINLIWKHYILNLSWILAFCLDMWINKENLKKYILNLKLPKNTLEIIVKKVSNCKVKIINDTYNLSNAWLFAWLELLNSFSEKPIRVLVLDDILELGKESKNIHFEIWKEIAEKKLVDKIYYIWVNYKENFESWLIKWWFNYENIISNVDIFMDNSVVLLEWRRSAKYLNNL
jgi:UDP-N-acetylmuramoyl-tripeptide--D-alanyl-D-alanine ligase